MKRNDNSITIWGKHSIREALSAGFPVTTVYIYENYHDKEAILHEIKYEFGAKEAQFKFLSRDDMMRMGEWQKKSGIAAEIKIPCEMTIQELLDRKKNSIEPYFFVILDHLEDPHNVGAIIRSAEGAGGQGIILPRARSAGITSTVIHTSAGAFFHLPVAEVGNIAQTIDVLKKRGIWIVGTDSSAQTNYIDMDFTLPLAIVIGSEDKGIRFLVRNKCDFMVKIPLSGKVQSLNASASAAVILFEAARQRSLKREGESKNKI